MRSGRSLLSPPASDGTSLDIGTDCPARIVVHSTNPRLTAGPSKTRKGTAHHLRGERRGGASRMLMGGTRRPAHVDIVPRLHLPEARRPAVRAVPTRSRADAASTRKSCEGIRGTSRFPAAYSAAERPVRTAEDRHPRANAAVQTPARFAERRRVLSPRRRTGAKNPPRLMCSHEEGSANTSIPRRICPSRDRGGDLLPHAARQYRAQHRPTQALD